MQKTLVEHSGTVHDKGCIILSLLKLKVFNGKNCFED